MSLGIKELSTCTPPGFEGPEKRLEVDFKINSKSSTLRSISKEKWQEMLDLAKCTIISSKRNAYFDSYVLSESSLFVYPYKVMVKTCGTTTLLFCIPKLLEIAKSVNLVVDFVTFSRKNLLYPHQQAYPHTHWNDEVDFLNKFFEGTAYVLGPLTQEHYYLYLADYRDGTGEPEHTLEIMMHNLNRHAAKQFYKKEGTAVDAKFPGIIDLIPGSDTDEYNFEPCGYSMNGLFENSLSTIHVTPEPQCSYASYETNLSLPCYSQLISQVLDIFKPDNFTISLFTESKGQIKHQLRHDLEFEGYSLKHQTVSQLEGHCSILLCNYESASSPKRAKRKRAKIPPSVLGF
jgi:S-adenosylmethionine decarboxylase